MGYSRDGYYRFQELYENKGEEALLEMTRRKPLIVNRLDPTVEKALLDVAIEYSQPLVKGEQAMSSRNKV